MKLSIMHICPSWQLPGAFALRTHSSKLAAACGAVVANLDLCLLSLSLGAMALKAMWKHMKLQAQHI